MCENCGCGESDNYLVTIPGKEGHTHSHDQNDIHYHDHPHDHGHSHDGHDHEHRHPHSRRIEIEKDALYKNNLAAERNRGFFDAKDILAINLVSSPGSGKTSLLEKTISELKNTVKFAVVEGDQQTTNDADRIHATGVPVVQVNTGNGCHLDAAMVGDAVKNLKIADHSVLMIENVGNLVCPALFDLGEKYRVVIVSVTEGEDKPLKYPNMFQTSQLCILNKTDLVPYLDIDIAKMKEYALQVNHHLEFMELSVKSGEGFQAWIDWLRSKTG